MSDPKLKSNPKPEGGEELEEELLEADEQGEDQPVSEGEGGDPVEGAEGDDEAPEEEVADLRARGKSKEGVDELRALRDEMRRLSELVSKREEAPVAGSEVSALEKEISGIKSIIKSDAWQDMDDSEKEEHRVNLLLAKQALTEAKARQQHEEAQRATVGAIETSALRIGSLVAQIHKDMPHIPPDKIASELVLNPDLVKTALRSKADLQSALNKKFPAKKVLRKDTGYAAPGAKQKVVQKKAAAAGDEIPDEEFLKL